MELQQDTPLELPLFLLNDNIENRDLEQPDLRLSVMLTDNLLANLCQNPTPEESISIPVVDYELNDFSADVVELFNGEHQLQLLLNNGPVLSAILNVQDQLFVSPPVEMMPTFDLGLDEDEQ
ncbi:hypothetical protein ACSLBF_00900 [Pseudoalteromonas sp. T1lg65]|uniref:hypothetical protein n=1 Tax=Pseudoalteromonas sp. T1lg65 TaxID=2077101 RepID=UPI003F78D97C